MPPPPLFWLSEAVPPKPPGQPLTAAFEVKLAFEPDEIEPRVLAAAERLLEQIADRGGRDKLGVPDDSPGEDATDEAT